MIDKEQFDYTMNKIRQSNITPYQMSNKILAEELLPYIQQILPNIRMVKCGIFQWFIKNDREKRYLIKELERIMKENENKLKDLEKAISQLNQEDI